MKEQDKVMNELKSIWVLIKMNKFFELNTKLKVNGGILSWAVGKGTSTLSKKKAPDNADFEEIEAGLLKLSDETKRVAKVVRDFRLKNTAEIAAKK